MNDPCAQAILAKLLPLVAEQGWTVSTLRQAGQAAGESPQTLRRLFPQGVTSALTAWQRLLDDQMVQRIQLQGFTSERIRDRVAQGVWTRLELIGEQREAFEMATRQRVYHPQAVLRDLWHSADAIWNLAGDTATDYNYYTKRLLLAQLIYKVTLSYLGDVSADFADTRDYLNRQIDAIVMRGAGLNRVKPVLDIFWRYAERLGIYASTTS